MLYSCRMLWIFLRTLCNDRIIPVWSELILRHHELDEIALVHLDHLPLFQVDIKDGDLHLIQILGWPFLIDGCQTFKGHGILHPCCLEGFERGIKKKRQQKKRPKFEGFPFWGTNFSQLLDSSYHLIIILFIHLISRISWPFRAFHFCCCDFSSFTSTSTGTCFMASGFFTKMACSDGCPG